MACFIHKIQAVFFLMQEINSWHFDVYNLNEVTENNALKYVGLNLFHAYKFLSKYKVQFFFLNNNRENEFYKTLDHATNFRKLFGSHSSWL